MHRACASACRTPVNAVSRGLRDSDAPKRAKNTFGKKYLGRQIGVSRRCRMRRWTWGTPVRFRAQVAADESGDIMKQLDPATPAPSPRRCPYVLLAIFAVVFAVGAIHPVDRK